MRHYTVRLPDGMDCLRTDSLELAREVCAVVLGSIVNNWEGR